MRWDCYFASISVNIKTTDRNAYMHNKITLDTKNIDTSSQFVKEVNKLRYATLQSKPTTTTEIETWLKPLNQRNHMDMVKFQLNYWK